MAASSPGTLRVGRYLLGLLVILALLYTVVFFPGNRHKPKLGIDLVGGVRVVFTAVVPKGDPAPTSAQMTQARQILEDRINTTGVTGATVVVQGTNQLVVEIPNGTSTDVAKLGKAAVLNFRGLIEPGQVVTCQPKGAKATPGGSTSPTPSGSATASPSGASSSPAAARSGSSSRSGQAQDERPLTAPTSPASSPATPASSGAASSGAASSGAASSGAASSGAASSGAASSGAASSPAAKALPCQADPFSTLFAKDKTLQAKMPNSESCPSPAMPKVNGKEVTCKPWSGLSATQQGEVNSALANFDCTAAQSEPDRLGTYYVACDNQGIAYLLGHVVVRGRDIDDAVSQAPSTNGQGNAEWSVNLTLGGSGADNWASWTGKYNTGNTTPSVQPYDATALGGTGTPCSAAAGGTPCSYFVGFTLDGQVISIPITNAALSTQTQISGSFTQKSADALAQELNYGKLPISFRADSYDNVSATLGTSQLHAALLAGGIGLVLVIIYSLLYYRGLGLVTIASLIVSAGLTYAMLVILGQQIGFTLDLSGIAGFIVALGITADSFVVFFERIKDEVHEGRSVRVAVPRAWVRARRTILSADTVSFLAAAILYYFASADVKGFAFTLGMSTILDLVVVFLFTHPLVSLLSRSAAFGSSRFTGLDAVRGSTPVSDPEDSPRRTRPARGPARRAASGTVVLDKDATTEDDTVTDTDTDTDDHTGTDSVTDSVSDGVADSATEDGSDADAVEETRPRRRTTPAAGSAADRAAARRARLKQQSDDATEDES